MNNTNNNKYNIMLVIFLVLLLVIAYILMTDNFLLHQSLVELQDLNNEIINKFEKFEIHQEEKIKELNDSVNKKLEEISNNDKVIKQKIHGPSTRERIIMAGTLTLCFYIIIFY